MDHQCVFDPKASPALSLRDPDSSPVTIGQPILPRWVVCARCGHPWRSRGRGLRFRCRRCEAELRAAAQALADRLQAERPSA